MTSCMSPLRPVVLACGLTAAMLVLPFAAAALPAFPGAEGFGSETPGGRGGAVVEVTSLDDAGPGTLRAAFESASGPRTIVFRLGGTITLASPIEISGEEDSFVTVAGQTAPGDGIQVARYGLHIRNGAHDLVLRYLRMRPGNGSGDFRQDIDGIELWGNDGTRVHDVIVDHCSLEWAMDENFSSWADVVDITVQRSLIAEALLDGQDHFHAKGVLVGAGNRDPKPDRFSFHHNVFAHNPDRSPRLAYAVTDFRNNVIYDWGGNNSTMFGPYASFPTGPHPTDVNIVANIWKRGPGSSTTFLDAVWLNPNTRIHVSGNRGTQCPTGCVDEWNLGFREEFHGFEPADAALYRVRDPFVTPFVTTFATASLEDPLVANVGASRPVRDAVDARILADLAAGTGVPGQNSDYPVLAGGSAPDDTDHDGMPDTWENAHGLNPADPADRNDDPDHDGYTNLEDYLAAIGPTEFGCGDGIVVPGEDCDDGNRVNGDGCDTNCTATACGNGVVTTGEECDDGNLATGDCCDGRCHFEAASSPCDDGELCTPTDACNGAGACVGAEAPPSSCNSAARGSLLVDATRARLTFKWQSGSAVTAADLGDPVHGGTRYAFCVHDRVAGVSTLRMAIAIAPSSASWKTQGSGLKYRGSSATAGGISALSLKTGGAGQSSVVLTAKGAQLSLPALPFSQSPDLTAQLVNDAGHCWGQAYSAPAIRNDGVQFKDSPD